jgi:hypothetical protein
MSALSERFAETAEGLALAQTSGAMKGTIGAIASLMIFSGVMVWQLRPRRIARLVPFLVPLGTQPAWARDVLTSQTMKRALFAAGLMLLPATSAWTQNITPNFSGTWNLDVAKSDFGSAPLPDSMVLLIEHKEPTLKVSSTQKGPQPQGEITNERNLTTDGKENTNRTRTMAGEQEVKSTSNWNGRTLVMAFKLEVQGTVFAVNDVWELSDDGKVLTILRGIRRAGRLCPENCLQQAITFSCKTSIPGSNPGRRLQSTSCNVNTITPTRVHGTDTREMIAARASYVSS